MELDEAAPEQLQDHLGVRIFTLCDHAVVPPDGKIYIHGGGVHTLYVGQIPGPLRSLYLVVRLSIPWHMLGETHTVKIRALDLDRKPVSPTDPRATDCHSYRLAMVPGPAVCRRSWCQLRSWKLRALCLQATARRTWLMRGQAKRRESVF